MCFILEIEVEKVKKEIKKGVSVIIPTFNRAKYLYPTLVCLVNQKVDVNLEYEIVIVDSGDDETEAMVKTIQNKGKTSITYKKIKNCKNRSLLRNTGADLANYSIICFLDNDMLTPPDFVQMHYIEHEKNPQTVIMGARRFLTEFKVFEFGEEKLVRDFNSLENLPWYEDERLYEDIEIQPWRYVFSHTLSMEKKDFDKAGKFNNGFGNHWGFEDIELGIRLQKIGLQFKLFTKSFTYHQPHFQQSNIEQHEKSYNEMLFMKTHNYYESELYKCFYTNFGEYYEALKKCEGDYIYPDKKTQKKFDVILGALNSLDGCNPSNSKIHLGTYCIEKTNSKEKVLVLNDLFKFPEIIKISILFEAYRIAPKVYFKNISVEQENEIINLSLTSGIVVKTEKQGDYTVFVKDWNQDSRLYLLLLPDVLQPEKRYVYLWLAEKLLSTNHYVKIRDMKNTIVLDKEDFCFALKKRKSIENNINRYYGKNRLQFIGSASMLMTDMQIEFPKTKSSYIFYDDDYQLIYESIKERHIGMCNCYDESVYSILTMMSVYDVIKDYKITENAVDNNSFCCFMENGYLEDGIDIILEAFKEYKIKNENFSVTIKMPNYEEIKKEVFPLHNESSKITKTFASSNKFVADYNLLLQTIKENGLENNFNIIRDNYAINKIIDLINNHKTLVCASRGCCGFPELYAALLLKKKVIIPNHLRIPDILKKFCNLTGSITVPFTEELKVPVSCINSSYLAFRPEAKELLNSFDKEFQFVLDELINEIIKKGNKFFNDVFS